MSSIGCNDLPNKPCGTAIVHCSEELSPRTLPDALLELTAYYAINDPDPDHDIWADPDRKYYGGDPFSHGINCCLLYTSDAADE